MRKFHGLLTVVITLSMASGAFSASLDQARRLHREGSSDEALAEIEAILGSEAPDSDKAEALDLLGAIAVDKGYLAMAKQAWSRLTADYPDYVESTDARTKLALVSALLEAQAEEPTIADEPTAEAEETAEAAAVAESQEPASEKPVSPTPTAVQPVTQAAAASAPEPAAEPAAALAEPEPESAPQVAAASGGLVLVAARGKPHDAVMVASAKIIEFLRELGVNAVSASGGLPVVQDSKMVLPMLLQAGKEKDAESLLLLSADYSTMQKMVMDCYLPEGAELWHFKVSGGTGFTGRPVSPSGINENLVRRFQDKLEKRVGGPGLPVTLR